MHLIIFTMILVQYRKLWTENTKHWKHKTKAKVVSELDSQLEGHGFESHPMLDGNGVKAMPRSIPVPAPNPGSLINGKRKKILVA